MPENEKDRLTKLTADLKQYIANAIAAAVSPLIEQIATIETRGVSFEGRYVYAQCYRRAALVVHDGNLFVATRFMRPGETPNTSDAWQHAASGRGFQ